MGERLKKPKLKLFGIPIIFIVWKFTRHDF